MWVDRYEGLIAFLGLAGRVDGRKKLHKAVYLAQELGFPGLEENFDYHWFGPYSETLACELGEMALLRIVKEDKGTTPAGYPTYVYELANEARERFVESIKRVDHFRPAVRQLMQEDARFLELVATMYFFMKHGYSPDEAFREVKERKAEQNYTEAERRKAEAFLEQIRRLFEEAKSHGAIQGGGRAEARPREA